MARFLVLGEINADLVLAGGKLPEPGEEALYESARLVLGSASAICASGLAKLGNEVAFLGLVGDDFFGRFCLDEMRRAGIDVSGVEVSATEPTGITVSLSAAGDRALATFPGTTARFHRDRLPARLGRDHDHLHLSSYFLQTALRPALPTLFEAAREASVTTSLDPGHDPAGRWDSGLRELLPLVDIFLPNGEELSAIGEDITAAPSLGVAVKLGRAGAEYRSGATRLLVEAPPVEALDTTGAGDSFNAGFLHAWKDGQPIEACLKWGVTAGSLSTRALGGTAGQPSLRELTASLSTST